MERVKGIEPSCTAWKAVALPLSYTRTKSFGALRFELRINPPKGLVMAVSLCPVFSSYIIFPFYSQNIFLPIAHIFGIKYVLLVLVAQ
jgi:hypothetical protein